MLGIGIKQTGNSINTSTDSQPHRSEGHVKARQQQNIGLDCLHIAQGCQLSVRKRSVFVAGMLTEQCRREWQ